jgi:uncharacterized protein
MTNKLLYFFGFIIVMSILFLIVSTVGAYFRSGFKADKINAVLMKYDNIKGNMLATLVGIITPFCSCTTVPVFAGLVGININFGVAMSFLISSPTMNIAAFILLLSLFGVGKSVIYLFSCIFTAVFGGMLIGKITGNDQIRRSFVDLNRPFVLNSFKESVIFSLKSLRYYIFIFIIAALAGALIYNFVPENLIGKFSVFNGFYMVFVAVIIGAVIYADIILLIPVGYALMLKGVNQGIILAFMLSASCISLPGIIMLSRIIKTRPLILFVSTLIVFYSALGLIYFFMG